MRNLFLDIVTAAFKNQRFIYSHYFQKKTSLDLGCGDGQQLLAKQPSNAVGIDLNDESLEEASKSKLKVLKASVTYLPFRSNIFDAVNCNNLIEHLTPSEAHAMLAESARILKPKGCLIIHTQMAHQGIWHTFSHVRPYPPTSLLKLTSSSVNKEDYPTINNLKPIAIYYEGWFFENRLLFLLTTFLAYLIPFFRRDYTMVLQKTRQA